MKKLISILKLNGKNKKGVIASIENIYGEQTLTDVELTSINGSMFTLSMRNSITGMKTAQEQLLYIKALSMAS